MTYRRLAWAFGACALAACTATSDRAERGAAGKQASAPPEHEGADGHPIARCNEVVANAEKAVELAEEAKRAAGFPDEREDEGPKALVSEGFLISPMIPSQWPPSSDCSVVFYVFEAKLFVADSTHDRRDAVVARITLRLDDGEVDLDRVDGPGLGGELPYGGGGSFAPDLQQWIFDAVATTAVPQSLPAEARAYRKWLRAEEYVAAALFVWHRDFFEFVVDGDEEVRRQVEVHTRSPPEHRTDAEQNHTPPVE